MVTFSLQVPDYKFVMLIYRVIHLKCPKRQALRRVKDALNPPTIFAM